MKKQLPDKEYTVSDFQFSIYPKTITFPSPSNQRYSIYIEKGAQVIGKIEQIITAENKNFVFSVIQRKKFRIFNDKTMSYQWCIYKITENQTEQFLQSSNFSLVKTYSTYLGYFKQAEIQLRKNFRSKQNPKIQQIWKSIKKMTQHQSYVQKCYFKISSILLQFQCQIKSEYDLQVETYELKKIELAKFKQGQARRKSSQSLNSINDSRIKNSQVSFDSKKQERESQVKQIKQSKKNKILQSQEQSIRESQIQIFDPEGAKIDMQKSSESDKGQKKEKSARMSRSSEDYSEYQKKRNSMLSDIIEQSYQGSSNINQSKSAGQQKLKLIDTVVQDSNESPFSPVVRTQTFQSQKFDEIINFKRTATLRHKTSKDYQLQRKQEEQEQAEQEQQYSKHTHTQEQLQESVENIYTLKAQTSKKLIIILIIIVIFTIFIGGIYWKSNKKKTSKIYRKDLINQQHRFASTPKTKRAKSKTK